MCAVLGLTSGIRTDISHQMFLLRSSKNSLSSETADTCHDRCLYINRELSWLEFNRRVLEEAKDKLTPIMEKLKFASIFSSNLDEFIMIRVGGLTQTVRAGTNDRDPSGKTGQEQLDDIAGLIKPLVLEQYLCLINDIL